VSNFTATDVNDGVTPSNTGAKATGLEVYGVFVEIENCNVSGISANNPQDLQAAGFSAWGLQISFTGCTATHVTVNNSQRNTNPGSGLGFGWAPDPRSYFCKVPAIAATYVNCSAANCDVGFDTWNHVNSTWRNVKWTKCPVGIQVQPGATRTITGNKCSECVPPIKVTIVNQARGNTYPGS
jgi:hypothetical protein